MDASVARKKQGVVCCSITNLGKCLTELEGLADKNKAFHHAQRLLVALDTEFKTVQYNLISTINETDDAGITSEQQALDEHDEMIDTLSVRIQRLLDGTNSSTEATSEQKALSRSISALETSLQAIHTTLESLPPEVDDLTLTGRSSDIKTELSTCRDGSYRLELPDDHDLWLRYSQLKTMHFNCCHIVKRILSSTDTSVSTSARADTKGLKVLKLEAPAFDGDVLNWKHFWEQFSISIYSRANLSDAEKFVYLQRSLEGGSARSVIQGLSGTGENYSKAFECLKSRYDRPRLIDQSHVKAILETPSLKDGSGKELRHLHDTLQQHLHALDATECDPLSRFITSTIQLKLDPNTLFEWQKHTQTVTDVPPFPDILEFIDLRASASESTTKRPKVDASSKSVSTHFATKSSEPSNSHCVLCRSE